MLSVAVFAQAPNEFNYQGVARDNDGNVLENQSVALRISILSGSIGGPVEYVEIHSETTNAFGLFNVAIGGGAVVSGSFAGVSWGSDSHFVQVEMDPAGGTAYQNMGTSQLLSVPYALYAENSGPTGNSNQTIRHDGNGWVANSNLYNTGDRIGIGTSSPTAVLQVSNTEEQQAVSISHNSSSTVSPSIALDLDARQNDAANTFSIYNRVESKGTNTGGLNGQYNFMVGDNTVGTSGAVYGTRTLMTSSLVGSGKSLYGFYASFTGTPSANEYSFYAQNGNAYFADYVGIGTDVPTSNLHISHIGGTLSQGLRIERFGQSYWSLYAGDNSITYNLRLYREAALLGEFNGTSGAYTALSDERLKTNILDMNNTLDKVLALRVKKYSFKSNPNGTHIGLIAQEANQLFPELVNHSNGDGEEQYLMDYSGFSMVAIKAIQEQQEIIETQQKQIDKLIEAVKALQTK